MTLRTVLSIAIVTILAVALIYGARAGTIRPTRKPAKLPSTPWVVAAWIVVVVVIVVLGR
jgi:hypothetical protein